MFQLIKAELSYLRFAQIVWLIPIVIFMVIVYKLSNVINLTLYLSALIIAGNIIGQKVKEQRSNRNILLPFKSNTLALTRSLLISLPVLFFYIIGVITQLLYTGYHENWYDSIFEITMLMSIILVLGNLYLFIIDSYSASIQRSAKLISNSIIVSLLILAMIILALSIKNIFNNSFVIGVISIGGLIIGGFFMSAATINSYSNRKILTD